MASTEEIKNITAGIKRFLKNNLDVLKQVRDMPDDTLKDLGRRAGVVYNAMDASWWVNTIGMYTFAHLVEDALQDLDSADTLDA